jgi:hypothetical protein
MLVDEANLVRERENNRIATEAILIQLAAGSIVSTKNAKQFTKNLDTLAVRAKPRLERGQGGGEQEHP